ncbi:MAG TPA: alcohol dehydrogenase catalytic domain-containing protein [Limnochordales bacterium]|nr:alcohol dehydrogenase catalytic domain-containing protein [Limnochordales bacterium]
MEALQFRFSPLRYAFAKAVGAVYPGVFASRAGCLAYGDVPEPALPGPEWVKIETRLGGICGSDLNLITLRDSPSVSPFASFPFVIGHENVGVVRETGPAVTEVEPGQRVVVDPLLPCAVRGFGQPCANCRAGLPNRCLRFAEGALAPGLLLGSCRDTGGSWGEVFVAHRSQVIPVPDHVSDENAVLAEPFGCALHAVDVAGPPHGRTVLVIGGGVIGLCTIAALRIMAPGCRIIALVRHPFQADMARRLGADEVLAPRGRDVYPTVAAALGAKLLRPVLGPPVLVGGADVVYECAGSDGALNDALRFAAPGGQVVLLGLASVPRGIDWTFVWLKELQVQGVFAAGPVRTGEGTVSAVQRAIELFAEGAVDLSALVTHRFAFKDYRQALATVTAKGSSGCLKAVFVAPAGAAARAGAGAEAAAVPGPDPGPGPGEGAPAPARGEAAAAGAPRG